MQSVEVLYWHWLVFGMLLMAMEIVVPSFTLLWFGAGAIVTGILLYFSPISLEVQLLIWTTLSVILACAWFKYLKPLAVNKTKAGLPESNILGETAQVIKLPNVQGDSHSRGELRFSTPKLGSEEWEFMQANPDEILALGDRVRVTSVSGNTLVVSKA